jgi:hypothetical protein
VAKNGKRSDKRAKRDKRAKGDKREKRSQRPPALAPVRDLSRSAPAAMAVAAGALMVAGIASLWRVRR